MQVEIGIRDCLRNNDIYNDGLTTTTEAFCVWSEVLVNF